jgi:hypothetical protein
MPRKKTNIPANETPAQRFVRLANMRVNRLLSDFKSLAQLRGKLYVSTPEQRKKIGEVLTETHTRSMKLLESAEVDNSGFKL